MHIATNDHTTAFVVEIPTPFAPPYARYPHVQLMIAIAAPKKADLSSATDISLINRPCHNELI